MPEAGATATPSRIATTASTGGEWHEAAVYDEGALAPGLELDGPAIVEMPDTTIVIGRDQRAGVDEHGNVVITPGV